MLCGCNLWWDSIIINLPLHGKGLFFLSSWLSFHPPSYKCCQFFIGEKSDFSHGFPSFWLCPPKSPLLSAPYSLSSAPIALYFWSVESTCHSLFSCCPWLLSHHKSSACPDPLLASLSIIFPYNCCMWVSHFIWTLCVTVDVLIFITLLLVPCLFHCWHCYVWGLIFQPPSLSEMWLAMNSYFLGIDIYIYIYKPFANPAGKKFLRVQVKQNNTYIISNVQGTPPLSLANIWFLFFLILVYFWNHGFFKNSVLVLKTLSYIIHAIS